MLLDYMRLVNAAKKFNIKDDFKFLSLDDITLEDLSKDEIPEQIEIWASVRLNYDGELPESYRTLNILIGDWVENHEDELTKVIHEHLKEHVEKNYPDATHDLDTDESSIWLDQLDYMPRSEEGQSFLDIEIELVLDVEPVEEEEC
jgi:hypothetical protein